jgi:hypothetical protein
VGVFYQLGQRRPEPTAELLALPLEPRSQLLTDHLLHAGKKISAPAGDRGFEQAALYFAFEHIRVELERPFAEDDLLRVEGKPLPDEVAQLQECLTQRLARAALIPLGPQQRGRLCSRQGSRTPPSEVAQEHQLLAPAGEHGYALAVQTKLPQCLQTQHEALSRDPASGLIGISTL